MAAKKTAKPKKATAKTSKTAKVDKVTKKSPAKKSVPKKNLIVLGYALGRSGSSAVMGFLQKCGAYLGEVNDPTHFNKKGIFENQELMEFYLSRSGASYSYPTSRPTLGEYGALEQHGSDFLELIDRIIGSNTNLAIKAPAYLPLAYLRHSGFESRYNLNLISLSRDPEAQAASIRRLWQTWKSPYASKQIVDLYVEAMNDFTDVVLDNYAKKPQKFLFEDILRDPAGEGKKLCKAAGLKYKSDQDALDWFDASMAKSSAL